MKAKLLDARGTGDPTRQEEKVFLNLAGEFAVASELNRRRILASVTYGPLKSADIFAVSRDTTRIVRVEVKTCQYKYKRWPIGKKGANPTGRSADLFWVLVLLPPPTEGLRATDSQHGEGAPQFFVLTPKELYDAYKEGRDEYNKSRRSRGLGRFRGLGVPIVVLRRVKRYEGQWQKIARRLGGSGN